MALIAPVLDDRHFQDIVDEARKRIPHYCKEWTDHNVSDPGITLIELFAWMTEMLIYRLNQVPDLHYIKLLQMLGVTLHGPQPAKVPVTFWLSAPQIIPVLIPVDTEIASTQTETEAPIIFSTISDLRINPPQLTMILSRISSGKEDKKSFVEHNLKRLQMGFEGIDVFTPIPRLDDALYFGFDNDLSLHILGFDLNFDQAGGTGIDPTMPPYIWEASTGKEDQHWQPCEVESDTTKGMNSIGHINIYLPKMGKYSVHNKELFWVRVRIKPISTEEQRQGMKPYDKSPRLRQMAVASWGGTVDAIHSQQISREFLGYSDGSPGQRFNLQRTPILARQTGENLLVTIGNEPPQSWTEVTDFADSEVNSQHFTLDSITGEIRFGPAVRQPDGTIKLFGAVPPRGASLIFTRYRCGGGNEGNVEVGVLNTLKTAIPFISRVINRQAAMYGLDAESVESAMVRAPALLRSRDRAVSESDYEFLASQALPASLGRVKCLQPQPDEAGRVIPGQVFLLVIPRVLHPEGFLTTEQLKLNEDDLATLTQYMEERRLLTTRLDIRQPAFHWVSVKVKLRKAPDVDQKIIEKEVNDRLYKFLNPITGGNDGKGWPFGRDLYASDVYQCLQGISNIQFLRGIELFQAKPAGEAQGAPVEVVEVVAHGVIASGVHSIEFV
jgi:predicted phage baseplate assembly protein